MSYFWANLGAHMLITLILLIVFLWTVQNSQRYRWKRGFLFVLPTVLMVIILVQVGVFVVPRMLDSTTVLRSTFRIGGGTIDKVSSLKDHIVVDGEEYYVNPFEFDYEVGDEVTIKYTPYAHYAYSVEIVEEQEKDA